MAGIGVQGLVSSLTLQDSPLSDFGNTLPGKLLTGISGAAPSKPPSAGNTKAPLADAGPAGGAGGNMSHTDNSLSINGPVNVQANSIDEMNKSLTQQYQQHRMQYTSPQGP
jgi:hypothetical protein